MTKDLRPKKALVKTRIHEIDSYYEEDGELIQEDYWYTEYSMHPASFMIEHKDTYSWNVEDSGIEGYHVVIHDKDYIVVGEDDILPGVIPNMDISAGCCNWAMGYPLTCKCGREVAALYLDCYELGVVKFHPKFIVRSYK